METQALEKASSTKAPVAIGKTGVVLQTLDDLWRFANYISKSGFAPKAMEAPETIVVAVQMGMEIGLSPMASMQNIAVINGRPSVWGDAVLAIVQNSGILEVFDEYFEQDGKRVDRAPSILTDGTVAVCRVKRQGRSPQTSSFGVVEAKRAGLCGKQGPWTQYPSRMLQLRARGFALRDSFPDFLKGLITREEAQDIDPVEKAKNITPKESAPVIVTKVSDGDDIPMAYDKKETKQASTFPTDNETNTRDPEAGNGTETGSVVEVVTPQDQLADAVLKSGVGFDLFVSALKDSGKLAKESEPTGFEDLKAEACAALLAKPKILAAILNAAKSVGGSK